MVIEGPQNNSLVWFGFFFIVENLCVFGHSESKQVVKNNKGKRYATCLLWERIQFRRKGLMRRLMRCSNIQMSFELVVTFEYLIFFGFMVSNMINMLILRDDLVFVTYWRCKWLYCIYMNMLYCFVNDIMVTKLMSNVYTF